jgi:hypothetical protein
MMMMSVEQLVEWELAGETEYSEKISPSATSSTTNLKLSRLGSNPDHRYGKPETNRQTIAQP